MSDIVTLDLLREIIRGFADTMEAQATYLTKLDEAIGDGDHGRNMAIGFRKVWNQLQNLPATTPPDAILRTAGMTLVTTVGGASGPLYGAAFIAAGLEAQRQTTLTLIDLARMTQAAVEAITRRGRCRPGDKTILDAMLPASQTLNAFYERSRNIEMGLEAATQAAKQGMEATIPLLARRGLAMQYGEASIGHQDPGATSCYLLFESAWKTVQHYSQA